jgi:hypothetical protein
MKSNRLGLSGTIPRPKRKLPVIFELVAAFLRQTRNGDTKDRAENPAIG